MMTLVHRGGGMQLMGTNEIENLQRALANLAVATQNPMINAKVTGTVDDQTMTAISAALGLLTKELPEWLYLALQGVMLVGATNDTAKKYVGQYATQLTLAANTASVKFKVNPPPVVVPTATQAGFFAPGWYTSPLGIVLIIAAALVGYKLFIAKPGRA